MVMTTITMMTTTWWRWWWRWWWWWWWQWKRLGWRLENLHSSGHAQVEINSNCTNLKLKDLCSRSQEATLFRRSSSNLSWWIDQVHRMQNVSLFLNPCLFLCISMYLYVSLCISVHPPLLSPPALQLINASRLNVFRVILLTSLVWTSQFFTNHKNY